MITWRVVVPRRPSEGGVILSYRVGDCLSKDDKPTNGIYNGSVLYEIDTKKSYKFDAENSIWHEAATDSGGMVSTASIADVREVLNYGD